MRCQRTDRGFTLVEVLVVMLVLGLLAAIAVPVFLAQRATASETVQRATARNVQTYLTAFITQGLSTTYRRSVGTPGSAAYLQAARENVSNALEVGLEQGVAGQNVDGYANPFSGKRTVVNWNTVYTDAQYVPPAIWITDASAYRYAAFPAAGNATTVAYLRGTVIVNFDAAAQRVEVFWVDGDGRRGPALATVRLR